MVPEALLALLELLSWESRRQHRLGWFLSTDFLATSGTFLDFALLMYKAHCSFQVSSVKVNLAYSLGTAEP